MMSNDIGLALGAFVLGPVVERMGFSAMFAGGAAVVGLRLLLFGLIGRIEGRRKL